MTLPVRLADRCRRLVDVIPESSQWSTSTPLDARRHARSALERGETHYTDRPGVAPLRDALSRQLENRLGRSFSRSQVLVTCGSTEARFVAVQCLLQVGGTLYVVGPDPAIIEGAAIVRGGRVSVLQGGVESLTAADIVYLDARVPNLEVVIPNLAKQGPRVIYDISFVGEQGLMQLVEGRYDRSVIVGDVCAQHGMIGWRVGFLAAQTAEFDAMRDLKQALTICTTNLSQWAALACVEGGL